MISNRKRVCLYQIIGRGQYHCKGGEALAQLPREVADEVFKDRLSGSPGLVKAVPAHGRRVGTR